MQILMKILMLSQKKTFRIFYLLKLSYNILQGVKYLQILRKSY